MLRVMSAKVPTVHWAVRACITARINTDHFHIFISYLAFVAKIKIFVKQKWFPDMQKYML